ncbi:MAG: DHHA1 domain-containing protein [Anaerolineae bacterium]
MTQKLYHEDAYQQEFQAQVLERVTVGDGVGLILDKTCFYPTSGGQPHDQGTLNGIPVIDVFEREDDGAVVHIVGGEVAGPALSRSISLRINGGETVHGQIDWERRFDHMQQHTGQHILSQAFLRLLGAETVGFHLGAEAATIDVDKAPLEAAPLDEVENLANAVVFADRPVRTYFVDQDRKEDLALRKQPVVPGPIRIIEVEGFDLSPCGGTHVKAAGEVGPIAITKSERRGSETRVEFLCGGRALTDYRRHRRIVGELANQFSVGDWELVEAVNRLAEEARRHRKELNVAKDQLLDYEAARLWAEAEERGGLRIVRAILSEGDGGTLKGLVQRLAKKEACVALLGLKGDRPQLAFARSADLPYDMSALLKGACQVIGGSGGGRPDMAQGGGPAGGRLEEALEFALEALRETYQ